MKKLENKVAVVTGGSKGIGLATAKKFVAEGAYVYITARNKADLDKAVAEIGDNVTGIQADATNNGDLERLYQQVKAEKGHVDVVVANVGGAIGEMFGQITESNYQAQFDLNVKSTLFTVQYALPLFSKTSSVVIIGSVAGSKGLPGLSVYGAAKAAVRAFARVWAFELRESGIRVNLISPGPVATHRMQHDAPREFVDFLRLKVPSERLGEEIEIANAVTFLASDDSSFINGVELFADGGLAQV